MGLNCGIVGLPNVGKSTIFSPSLPAPAEAANYPFCTIEPNVGYRERSPINAWTGSFQLIPTSGWFRPPSSSSTSPGGGRSLEGEGLGNRFLASIREVRRFESMWCDCFENPDIIHVSNRIDPASDIGHQHRTRLGRSRVVDKPLPEGHRNTRLDKEAPNKRCRVTVLERLLQALGRQGRAQP
jgi:ribosome-binding ATPase YchF (GTP1/OBG family)